VTACKDFDLLLTLHAAGALDPADAARVEAHLATCAACRAEVAADADVLAAARLPPPTDAERRALADRPRRALAELHRTDRRRAGAKRIAAGIAVAAALLVAVLAPAVLQRTPDAPSEPAAAAVAAAPTWEEPDLDDVWDDAGVLELDAGAAAASNADSAGSDAALAALDL
jgi:anti-sigma factor RsiW